MTGQPPSDIARETLKQLVFRRLPPTPENYRALYDEIAGQRTTTPFPEGPLRKILRIIPGQTPAQKRLLSLFEAAVTEHSWTALQNVLVGYANLGLCTTPSNHPPETIDGPKVLLILPDDLATQLARIIESILPALDEDDARVHMMGMQLIDFLRQPNPPASTVQLMLNNFSYRLSFAAEDQGAVRGMLLQLLHMVFENIAALSQDDHWLQGQAEALVAATSQPLSLRRLDNVQLRLKDVIFKQTEAKGRMVETQEQMKEMLSAFITRLSSVTENSSGYHDMMEHCSEQIARASTLEEIAPVLKEVMTATRSMAMDSQIAHDELTNLRERAQEKHLQLEQLQQQLDRVSAQARHDPLTGTLNRKGLDEAMERELTHAQRTGSPLCAGLLDVDNFKQINDRLGHSTGDAALVHLAEVMRTVMRPQDMLARYGGEEFVLLLPNTVLPEGIEALQRLQRELTTRFFLQGNEKLLITFSAGVAQATEGETGTDLVRRADQGMYLAKRAGKNRVMAA
jgi:diguanylate cyclase